MSMCSLNTLFYIFKNLGNNGMILFFFFTNFGYKRIQLDVHVSEFFSFKLGYKGLQSNIQVKNKYYIKLLFLSFLIHQW